MEGKRLQVFLFGDYAFLCIIFGLSGSTAKFPCLWCHIDMTDMRDGKDDTPGALHDRTTAGIQRQHRLFKESELEVCD